MKDHPRFFSLAMLTLVGLTGCASIENFSCDMHENRSRGVKPFTQYQLQEPKPGQVAPRTLPTATLAQAPTYKLEFRPRYTHPCSTLTLHKNVVLLRSTDNDVVLTEIREMYAEDGSLITSHSQDISDQVRKSGAYIATTPLPIPKAAPDGKYKVVSRLMQERRADRRPAVPVARTEGYFYILPGD